mmetsp:Transcript_83654/g.270433  ORF Transcript_83654/g.270433 Transcript_83654/m.270433 type:complete len:175 (+) Transcript_83654:747-1271(+)
MSSQRRETSVRSLVLTLWCLRQLHLFHPLEKQQRMPKTKTTRSLLQLAGTPQVWSMQRRCVTSGAACERLGHWSVWVSSSTSFGKIFQVIGPLSRVAANGLICSNVRGGGLLKVLRRAQYSSEAEEEHDMSFELMSYFLQLRPSRGQHLSSIRHALVVPCRPWLVPIRRGDSLR